MPDKNRRHVDRDIAIQRMLALRDAVPDIAEYIQQLEDRLEVAEARLAESERVRNYLQAATGIVESKTPYIPEPVEAVEAQPEWIVRAQDRHTRRRGVFGKRG